jgi:hypothetical protein
MENKQEFIFKFNFTAEEGEIISNKVEDGCKYL